MKVLHLTLKKKWFDMIASGEKKEEYREVKDYWKRRLCVFVDGLFDVRRFYTVEFRNGYSKSAPQITVKCLDIDIATGNPNWGAEEGKKYFVIKLGNRLSPLG